MCVVARRIYLTVGLALLFGVGPGCGADEMAPYYYAAEIRRDAKVLLAPRPAPPAEPIMAASYGR